MQDRYISPYPKPTDHEREVLLKIVEECSEVVYECNEIITECSMLQKRILKAIHFGMEESEPNLNLTNKQRLGNEVGDLFQLIDLAISKGLISQEDIDNGRQTKIKKLAKYMQTDDDNG